MYILVNCADLDWAKIIRMLYFYRINIPDEKIGFKINYQTKFWYTFNK